MGSLDVASDRLQCPHRPAGLVIFPDQPRRVRRTTQRVSTMIDAQAINHIGIACPDLAKVHDFYEKVLGAQYEGVETVEDQKVKVAFYTLGAPGHEVRLELLEPTSDDSPIAKFIEKSGGRGGLHHVAYTVANIQDRIAELKAEGVQMIDETPRAGAHHTQIAFVHPKASAGILTELCEPAK